MCWRKEQKHPSPFSFSFVCLSTCLHGILTDVVLEVIKDMPAWPGRDLLEGGEDRRYFGLKTVMRGVVEFECTGQREHDIWTQGVSRLLSITAERSSRHRIWSRKRGILECPVNLGNVGYVTLFLSVWLCWVQTLGTYRGRLWAKYKGSQWYPMCSRGKRFLEIMFFFGIHGVVGNGQGNGEHVPEIMENGMVGADRSRYVCLCVKRENMSKKGSHYLMF